MDIDINPYRKIEASITPTEFEVFCKDTLKAYAEKENLKDFDIKHNQKIETHDGTYQIDVIAEYSVLGTQNIVLVECKKHKSNIERDVVVSLYTKMQSIGANKGIVISTAGFQSGAVKYAKAHGIALWQICDNYIKKYSASANNKPTDVMELEKEVDLLLPKYFMLEWDCSADFPYTQIYPTVEMEQIARNEVREKIMNSKKQHFFQY